LDVDALGRAIETLWTDEPRRRSLGEFGRSKVVPRYRWDAVVDQLERIYGAMVAG
jgi:glycosyltransferase involved in cell wall biosynthesis